MRRIFDLYDAGAGYRSIAQQLESEGLPSPGEVGPTKHPRSVGVWSGSGVRAILTNPRYLGRQVSGRQRRYDELLDTRDPALGTVSRQRWQNPDAWSWSEEPSWPALVPEDLFERVNERIINSRGHRTPRRPQSQPGRYVIAGLIRCGHCGKAMFGSTAKGNPYYRCASTRDDYATTSVPGHPRSYTVREERIITALDTWLNTLTEPKTIESTIAKVLTADDSNVEPPEVTRARQKLVQLQVELDRVLAAIRAGMDPALAAGQTRQIQAELFAAKSVVQRWNQSEPGVDPLTEEDVRGALTEGRGLVTLLDVAERPDRTALYRSLGLQVTYKKEAPTGQELVHARLELRGGGGRI